MAFLSNFPFLNYAAHVLGGAALLAIFFAVYTRCTAYDEMSLIRQGNSAAALSLAGALIGFSLTIASAVVHGSGLVDFLIWAAVAMAVQVAAYAVTVRFLGLSKEQIEGGNVAFGGLLGAISITAGILNAACLS